MGRRYVTRGTCADRRRDDLPEVYPRGRKRGLPSGEGHDSRCGRPEESKSEDRARAYAEALPSGETKMTFFFVCFVCHRVFESKQRYWILSIVKKHESSREHLLNAKGESR